jgi:hypothetical protein
MLKRSHGKRRTGVNSDVIRIIGCLLGILAFIVIVVGAIWYEHSLPKSSPDLKIIDKNTAQLHPGQRLVLRHHHGKSTDTWYVTFDGTTVHVDEQNALSNDHYSTKLCGPDCTATIKIGWVFKDEFTAQPDPNVSNAADVVWPWGWNMN